ncbi:hypothetical protein KC845_03985, partial [Candidatus Kaiserbacteria bacterium]|nr:hypothetical protein [Candidatus Kaiserbacteria bacterium]
MSTAIIDRIKKEIENINTDTIKEGIGFVSNVGDGIAEIEGLSDAEMMEMVVFDESGDRELSEILNSADSLFGLILNLEEDVIKVVILGDAGRVSEGMKVRRTNKLLSIPVGEDI